MFSEGSCYSEDWTIILQAKKFTLHGINHILKYTSQHLKWIKTFIKVVLRQEHILVLGFRTTLMKGFDPLQMLTSVF